MIYGLGTIVGSAISGWVRKGFGTIIEGVLVDNWTAVWLGPFLLTLVSMLIFALFFREGRSPGASRRPPNLRLPYPAPEPSAT